MSQEYIVQGFNESGVYSPDKVLIFTMKRCIDFFSEFYLNIVMKYYKSEM